MDADLSFWSSEDGVAGVLAGDDYFDNNGFFAVKSYNIKPTNSGFIEAHYLESVSIESIKSTNAKKLKEVPNIFKNPDKRIDAPANKKKEDQNEKKIKKVLLIINISSCLSLTVLLYWISDLIDFFPWGSSQRDGLFLILIPFVYLPIFLLLGIFSIYSMKENISIPKIYRYGYFLICIGLIISTVILPKFLDNSSSTILIFFTVLGSLIFNLNQTKFLVW